MALSYYFATYILTEDVGTVLYVVAILVNESNRNCCTNQVHIPVEKAYNIK